MAGLAPTNLAPGRFCAAALLAASVVLPRPSSVYHTSAGKVVRRRTSEVIALQQDNQLVALSLPDGHPLWRLRLGRTHRLPRGTWRTTDSHYLALSRDGRTLFALVPETAPGRPDGADQLAVVDLRSHRLRARYTLPRGIVFQSLAAGPTTGRLYLFGFRPLRPVDPSPADAVVSVLDPRTGAVQHTWLARPAEGRFWFPYRGLVSTDERTLYISYHGGGPATGTTGVDVFQVSASGLQRCPPSPYTGYGCISAHGNIEFYRGGLLAAIGSPPWILQIDAAGTARRDLHTRLHGNHLLEFVLDRSSRRVYAVGSCVYAGGLSVLDLRTGKARLLAREDAPYGVCGERLVLGPAHLLIVAKTAEVPASGLPGSLLLLDRRSGRVLHHVDMSTEAVDLIIDAAPA